MSYIVLQHEDGSIKAVPDAEWRQNPIPLGQDGWFAAEVIDGVSSPEQAIWKASRSNIQEEVLIAADFLKVWLEATDWEMTTDQYLKVRKLAKLIQEITPEDNPLNGLIAVTDEDGFDVLLLAVEEWENNAEEYNNFHGTTWTPYAEANNNPDQLKLAL